jgi:hypothetical protein
MIEHRSFRVSGIAPAYEAALRRSLLFQALFSIPSGLMLDMGRENRYVLGALSAQWTGILLCLIRRPLAPTKLDLLFIKYSLLPLIVSAHIIAPFVWEWLGHHEEHGPYGLLGSSYVSSAYVDLFMPLPVLVLIVWEASGALHSVRSARARQGRQ